MPRINPQTIERLADAERDDMRDMLFKATDFTPHKGQVPILRSNTRHRLAAAGRRFGKSTIGGAEVAVEALITRLLVPLLEDAGKFRMGWIIGPEYTDSAKEFRAAYNMLQGLGVPFDRPGTYYNEHDGDMRMSLYKGRFVCEAKSAKHPERLVGEGLSFAVMAEAAKQRKTTWTRFVRPMLADWHGRSLFLSTPEGKNWFYDLWMAGQSELEPEWESWRRPAWINNHVYRQPTTESDVRKLQQILKDGGSGLSPLDIVEKYRLSIDPEIVSLINDLSSEEFNQEEAALFTEYVGRVFKGFDEEIHVKDLIFDPRLETYAAVDYGFTNPNVWLLLQVDVWGTVYVIDEFYERHLTIDEFAAGVRSRQLCPSNLREFFPDPADPGSSRALERKLQIISRGHTGGELNLRLRAIRAALKERNIHLPEGHPDRQPKLLINRRCANTIREFNDYRYPHTHNEQDKNAPEAPLKKDDHTPEALGRFFAGYFGAPESHGYASVADADFSR